MAHESRPHPAHAEASTIVAMSWLAIRITDMSHLDPPVRRCGREPRRNDANQGASGSFAGTATMPPDGISVAGRHSATLAVWSTVAGFRRPLRRAPLAVILADGGTGAFAWFTPCPGGRHE
jgi:hypothetical protein